MTPRLEHVAHGPAIGDGRAVVLLLHGLGRDPADAWTMLGRAVPDDVSVLALEGPWPMPDGAPGLGWFFVDFTPEGPRADLAQERASRAALVEVATTIRRGPAGDLPLIVMGFSQGGIVGLHALLEHPALFTASVVATGRLLDPVADTLPPAAGHKGKPVLWAHGRADPMIPLAVAAIGQQRVERDYGVELATLVHEEGHEVPAAVADDIRHWLEALL